MSILFEQNLESYLSYFQISKKSFFKTRLKMIFAFSILFFLFFFFVKNMILLPLLPLFIFLGWKTPYFFLVNQKKTDDIIKSHVFPRFLRIFISLFPVKGTVLRTLQSSTDFIEEGTFRKELEKLIDSIESREDDSSAPFIRFADYIGTSEAHMVLSFLYEFDQNGIKKEELFMLEMIVQDMYENSVNEICIIKENKMIKYANPPIFLALFFIFSFVVSIFLYYLENNMPGI